MRNRSSWTEATLPHWTLPQREAFLQRLRLSQHPPPRSRTRVTLTPAAAVEIYASLGRATAAALAKTVRACLLNAVY